jgi:plasmid stabilization system protein ParE
MYQLRYLEQAKSDLIHIKRYISKESGSKTVAIDYLEKLRQQCQKLAELPGIMGRARSELMEGIRSLPYGNYIILFRYNGSLVEIVSIIEGHRDIEELFRQ